jgi:hypothetical protein
MYDYENDYENEQLANENAQLQAQIDELASLESEYGAGALSTYRQLLAAPTAKAQIEMLKALSAPGAPSVPDGAMNDQDADSILADLSGPINVNPVLPSLPAGYRMNDQVADQILAGFLAPQQRRRMVQADITQRNQEDEG